MSIEIKFFTAYIVTNNTIKLNELPKECGVKFKTKEGCCKSIGKLQYGGFCGIHGKKLVV